MDNENRDAGNHQVARVKDGKVADIEHCNLYEYCTVLYCTGLASLRLVKADGAIVAN